MDVRRKYAGLRFLALLIKIVAWLALIFSVVVAIWFWIQGEKVAGLRLGGRNWTGVLFLPFGIYTFIQLYIIGSIISLFTDVEYNTRANATATANLISLMEKMEQRMAKSAPAVIATPPPPPPPPPAPDEPAQSTTPTEQMTPTPPPQATQPAPPIEESAPPPPPPPPPPAPEQESETPDTAPQAPEMVEEPPAPPPPEEPASETETPEE
jgi:hypothetical protein